MFREQLKNDIDRISPSPELLERVSAMMNEQAAKPRKKPYIAVLRYAGMAAAVALLAFGSVKLGIFNSSKDIISVTAEVGTAAETSHAGMAVAPAREADGDMDGKSAGNDEPDEIMAAGAQDKESADIPEVCAEGIIEYDEDCEECEVYEAPAEAAPEAAADGMIVADEEPDAYAAGGAAADVAPDGEVKSAASASAGGDGIESEYRFPINFQFSCIDGDFVELIGAELFDSWCSENRFSPEYNDYTDIDRFFNLYKFIQHFGIDGETAEKTMRGINERLISYGMEPMYSEEDIYILTHGTKDEISEHFANSCTVCHNGKLYTTEWFDTHTVDDYRAEGIPAGKIKEKLDNMLYLSGFYDLRGFAEKIGEYIGETVTLPDPADVPHPLNAVNPLEQAPASTVSGYLYVKRGGETLIDKTVSDEPCRLAELCMDSATLDRGLQLKMILTDDDIDRFMREGIYVYWASGSESFMILIGGEGSFMAYFDREGIQRLFALPDEIKAEVLEILG